MIADERIRVVNCEAWIQGFTERGLVLSHGKDIEADVVLFVTESERLGKVVDEIMGREVAERVGDIGHLNAEVERIRVGCFACVLIDHVELAFPLAVVATNWCAWPLVHDGIFLVDTDVLCRTRFADCCCRARPEFWILRQRSGIEEEGSLSSAEHMGASNADWLMRYAQL